MPLDLFFKFKMASRTPLCNLYVKITGARHTPSICIVRPPLPCAKSRLDRLAGKALNFAQTLKLSLCVWTRKSGFCLFAVKMVAARLCREQQIATARCALTFHTFQFTRKRRPATGTLYLSKFKVWSSSTYHFRLSTFTTHWKPAPLCDRSTSKMRILHL